MKPECPWPITTAFFVLVGAAGLITGCSHGDAIIFASNRQVGVKVGVDSKEIPEVSIGYNAQDFALVPLYKKDAKAPGNGGTNKVQAQVDEHGKYLATTDGKDRDAYSVYGSFVGAATGKGTFQSGPQSEASANLAQFFATGMAAQLLAKESGASAVNPFATAPAAAKAKEQAEAEAKATEAVARNVDQEALVDRLCDEVMQINDDDGNPDLDQRRETVAKALSLTASYVGRRVTEKVLTDPAELRELAGDASHYDALKRYYRGK